MFEIIMLFAFLSAAASQLLPADSSRGKMIPRCKKRPGRIGFAPGKKPTQKQQAASGKDAVKKGRSDAYACATLAEVEDSVGLSACM